MATSMCVNELPDELLSEVFARLPSTERLSSRVPLLNLESNNLTCLPAALTSLTQLEELTLGDNVGLDLALATSVASTFSSLKHLDIGWIRCGVLPDWVLHVSTLTSLNIQGNNLTALPNLQRLHKLQYLDLSWNWFNVFPQKALMTAKALRTLSISDNEPLEFSENLSQWRKQIGMLSQEWIDRRPDDAACASEQAGNP
ncbi:hypothetical protein WJX72_008427 [[Myrmecia] bisecta]|uniref:Uncharacterized protein n=1 Tax=[Myrmecia] bisecta TaxID=41462 RepID=A0AAW1PD45_9CHLO